MMKLHKGLITVPLKTNCESTLTVQQQQLRFDYEKLLYICCFSRGSILEPTRICQDVKNSFPVHIQTEIVIWYIQASK